MTSRYFPGVKAGVKPAGIDTAFGKGIDLILHQGDQR